MRDLLDIKGASGGVYRFSRLREGHPLSAMGGNFVYVRANGEGLELLYSGQTENLMREARARWTTAVEGFGAEHLYSRLNISERIRAFENEDILARRPPMNASAEAPAAKAGRTKKAD